MRYPTITPVKPSVELSNVFAGYNHTLNCTEGAYFDMKNMTSDYYPTISPRNPRKKVQEFTNFQGAFFKNGVFYVDNKEAYYDGIKIVGMTLTSDFKTFVGMGSSIIIFPDKLWYDTANGSFGSLDNTVQKTESISFTLTQANGTSITWHDAQYYEDHDPQNGDYKMETVNGKTILSVYSTATALWSPVATTYIKIAGTGIGAGFVKGDGVKITVDLTGITWAYAANIFVNDEGSNKRSNNFVVEEVSDNYVIVPALLDDNKTFGMTIKLERKSPDIAYVCECQNRLWGCSSDGHELYASKLGDYKNWNCFAGISTDSWAANVGSDGYFTGAVAFQGTPIFFKEDSLTRISISSVGAHSTKETKCRGVAEECSLSLVQVNEILFYKSTDSICIYDGSYPIEISKPLGEIRYVGAVGGNFGNKYYVCLYENDEEKGTIFTYDLANSIWVKEDKQAVCQFLKCRDEMYFIGANEAHGIKGIPEDATPISQEGDVSWAIESGNIGYLYTGKSHVNRINTKSYVQKIKVNVKMETGSHISIYVNYDSSNVWEFAGDISGAGTNLFTFPIRPHRCNHFRYRIIGSGDAKIFSITKEYTEGSSV